MSEYVPYFRKRPELFGKYKLVTTSERIRAMEDRDPRQDEQIRKMIESEEVIPIQHSREYCSQIIYSIERGLPVRINANVRNDGLITNLPQGCCVEVPCLVDKNGIHPCYVGDLPPQCAALNRTNINVQELGVLAAMRKDKNLAFQAVLLDPLTSAILTIEETRKMVNEMFEAEARYLPGFK